MRVALVGVVVGVRRTLCFVFHPHLLLQMKWQMTTIYDNDTAVGRAVVIVKAEGCKFETLHTHTHTHTHTLSHPHIQTHTHAHAHAHAHAHTHTHTHTSSRSSTTSSRETLSLPRFMDTHNVNHLY